MKHNTYRRKPRSRKNKHIIAENFAKDQKIRSTISLQLQVNTKRHQQKPTKPKSSNT